MLEEKQIKATARQLALGSHWSTRTRKLITELRKMVVIRPVVAAVGKTHGRSHARFVILVKKS